MSNSEKVYGFHAIKMLLKTRPQDILQLFMQTDRADHRANEIAALAKTVSLNIQTISKEQLEKLAGDQARHQGVFVAMLFQRKTACIAYDLQDVLIDGVDVKQVVLHLADDAAERGDVSAQRFVLIHAPQLVGLPPSLLEYRDKISAINRVAPERCVDEFATMP